MKYFKRITIIAFAFLLTIALISCNRKNNDINVELKRAEDALTYEVILGENESKDLVEYNLNLPTSDGDVIITWDSSNAEVISISGVVIRQLSNVTVTLEATLSYNSEAVKKQFELLVIAKEVEKTYFIIKTLTDAIGNNNYTGNKTISDGSNTYTVDANRVSVNHAAWMSKNTLIFAPRNNVEATATIDVNETFNRITLEAGLWNSAAANQNLEFKLEVYVNDEWINTNQNIYSEIEIDKFKTFTFDFNGDASKFRITVSGYSGDNNNARIAVDNINIYQYGIDPNLFNPTITLNTNIEETVHVPLGTEFIIPTATATDYNGNDITSLIETNHDIVNTNSEDIYELNWTVTDENGNTTKLTIYINVYEKAVPSDPSAYYSTINENEPLKSQLTALISNYTYTSYDKAQEILQYSDRDPSNPYNVLLIYNRNSVNGLWDGGSTWTREHVWPQSHLENEIQTSDAHNLRPINQRINESRGNLRFVEGSGEYSRELTGWYPGDEDRGDVARIIFYMATRYPNLAIELVGNLATFLEWHQTDPVDDFERVRNDVIYSYQDNRNPYIDNPEWVELVFGTQTLSYNEVVEIINIISYEINMTDLETKKYYYNH